MIEDNISKYVDVMLDSCDKTIDDNEDAILALLNNTEVDIEQKERYIGYITYSISSLSQIEDSSLWSIIIDKSKLQFSSFPSPSISKVAVSYTAEIMLKSSMI